jgi:predicted NBD/HSP70 family sugar kinase
VCAKLSERYGLPFFADNDCKAAALAEQVFGAARGKSILYVTISTGVGGTHVLDDGVYYGAFGHAGEVGLVIADRHGYASDQGLPGVLEAHACGRGLVRNYLAAGGEETVDGQVVDGRIMAELARAGYGPAIAALELEGRLLARALAPLCSAVDVGMVVIGGGMSLAYDTYGPSLEREFARLCPVEVAFMPTGLGYLGAFMGAVALALRGHAGELPLPSSPRDHVLEVSLRGNSIVLGVTLNGRERRLCDGSVPVLDGFLLAEDADDPGERLADRFARVLAPYGMELDEAFAHVSDAEVLDDLGYSLGRALAALATVLDPGAIVFSGVLGDSFDLLEPSVRRALVAETYYRGNLPFALGPASYLSNNLSL